MNSEDKSLVEGALIRAALRRLGAIPASLLPRGILWEQWGIAFAANDLNFAGVASWSVHGKLDEVRTAAISLANELREKL